MAPKPVLIVRLLCLVSLLGMAQTSLEYNRYLEQIFQKYGDGGTINFEGLEHLMYSLNLGQIEFDPSHTIDEHRPRGYSNETKASTNGTYFEKQIKANATGDESMDVQISSKTSNNSGPAVPEFLEIHDPKHRHPRESSVDGRPWPAAACLSPKLLLSLIVDHNDLHRNSIYRKLISTGSTVPTETTHNSDEEYNNFINSVRITPRAFMKLCPALLAQIDGGVCAQPAPRLQILQDKNQKIWDAWVCASISMFVLSACGLLGILLVPLMKTTAYQEILKFLVSIAVGTLAGDALMHLLPHALFKEEKHEQALDEGHVMSVAHKHSKEAALLCGCSFLAALFMYTLENVIPLLKGDGQIHEHSHGHGHSHGHSPGQQVEKEVPEVPASRELNVMLQETKLDAKSAERPLTPVAFMVIIGDGLHNLTDGLAIGAAFASDPVTGLATAFAVLCHELPHELGDFALLLQTGVSVRRAIYMNLVSSVLSFVGMAVGLFIAGIGDGMTQWIYAATAGSFLYIAFADLVPTMSVAHNTEMAKDPKGILIQVFGIFLGGLIMLIIALNEHDLEGLFKSF
ncbi:zinc transporter ZIP10 isoform X2 [Drosophila guanche]|uniref:Blast:Zinc transporter ZIP5 n=1 Tax=Drosophila guanche TaxID=7266 RepID=A0A3B0JQU3_DROGU|nr:zinc transporter ZIP10 isoform X1 [Drosophila guanche]XP_034122809.1 zinc transporter ZIP10 isoform X2 [Drosophila guanche]SPP76029.1 blast:Zinc transporter ZIP5 [Drosophila guanche]